jgi:FkbM family methyltransferase
MLGRLKNGQWIAVYKTDIKGNSLVDEGINEPIIHQIMQKVVKPGDVTIDLGANYGMITLSLGQFVGPQGKVFTLEASPPIAKVAALNAYINGLHQSTTYNIALMDKNGPVHMRIDNRWSGKTMVATKDTGVEVEGITLDDLLDRVSGGNPPHIDFYRLDIQGCECVALAGSQKTIDRSPNIILTMEWEIRLLKHFSDTEQ